VTAGTAERDLPSMLGMRGKKGDPRFTSCHGKVRDFVVSCR
jgi:hypothetical protein